MKLQFNGEHFLLAGGTDMGYLYDLDPLHPIIKFTHEFSATSIDLLDTTVKFGLVEFFFASYTSGM